MRFSEGMTEQIRIRVSAAEKRHLFEIAKKRGQSLSELLRQTATKASQRAAA